MNRQFALQPEVSFPHSISVVSLTNVRYVFLDRDGVVNRKQPRHRYVTHPSGITLCPGVGQAIATLNRLGIKVFIVTNQRCVSLGVLSEQQLTAIHRQLRTLLVPHHAHIDAIYYCPHGLDCCNCRKPLPGLFHQAFSSFPGSMPSNSIMIGDSLSDIQAGLNLNMRTVFINNSLELHHPSAMEARSLATYTASSLASFVNEALVKAA